MKRRLTQSEEFEIMKLVLDKFLWLGFGVMAFGLYTIFTSTLATGLAWMLTGAAILIILLIIIVKEFEVIR